MVVTAFMLGLGLGSLGGGALSEVPGVSATAVFCAAEAGIGLYGLGSLRLFQWVGSYTLRADAVETGLLAFALVFVPTALMGATLPLLVSYRVRLVGNVGQSVSWLYFANTLGAGLGALAAAFFVLHLFGLSGAARCAAFLNLIAVLSVAGLVRWHRTRP
jgi:predicted membrane-bound spermidine synthase